MIALVWALFCEGGSAADNGVERDWSKFPAVLQIHTTADVYAIGDVHGDYDRLVNLLATNRLVDQGRVAPEQVQWNAGRSILVCTGDLIDRWTNGIQVIRFFRSLKNQAQAAGGDVVVTMGNHEASFLAAGPDHQRTQDFERELTRAGADPNAVRRGEDREGLGQFLRSLPIMAVVNDWCFVHAGNLPGQSLNQIRTDLEKAISQNGFGAEILSNPDSLLEARVRPDPWWEIGTTGPVEAEAHLRRAVGAIGCQHLVTGHQPKAFTSAGGVTRQAGELCEKFNGLLFLIDTGMSRGIGLSKGALLWILTEKHAACAMSAQGNISTLWPNPVSPPDKPIKPSGFIRSGNRDAE